MKAKLGVSIEILYISFDTGFTCFTIFFKTHLLQFQLKNQNEKRKYKKKQMILFPSNNKAKKYVFYLGKPQWTAL
jgi:hypothetical protein